MTARSATILAIALVFLTCAMPPAAAFEDEAFEDTWAREFPDADPWYCGTKIDIDFVGSGWNPTRIQNVKDAVNEWEDAKKNNGAQVIQIQRYPSAGWADAVVQIRWDATAPEGNYGSSDCEEAAQPGDPHTGTIFINDDLQSESLAMQASVARHEMGHILQLNHTGIADSFGSATERATMATCLPVATAELRVMGQDDHANLAHQNAGESWDPILAERSFEENDVLPEYWAKFGGSWDIETSGAYVGDNYLEFTPSGANQYVYQSMNWVGAEGDDIDVRIAFKSLVGAASGDIEVELYRRVVEYDPWAAGDCFYVSGEDQNDRDDPPNSYVIISGSFDSWSAATSWQEKTSPTVTVNPPAGDHWDVRLRVYSDVNFSGNWTTVALDKLRIRDKG